MLLSPFYLKWPKRTTLGEAVLVTIRAQSHLTLQDASRALIGKLIARSTGGVLVIHIDNCDPDPVDTAIPLQIFNMLSWLNLEPDEFLDVGAYYPYLQRQRKEVYQEVARYLFEDGLVQYCFCSIDESGEAIQDNCEDKLDIVSDRLLAGERYTVRLKSAPTERLTYEDLFYGTRTFSLEQSEDVVLLTADGMPTPHFANVVDNHFMQVTTHIRYESALGSSFKELLLYKVLGWERPRWLHVPEVADPEVRNPFGESTVERLRSRGYSAEAIVQHLWQLLLPGMALTTRFTIEDMIDQFRQANAHRSRLFIDHNTLRSLSDRFA